MTSITALAAFKRTTVAHVATQSCIFNLKNLGFGASLNEIYD